MPTNQREMLCNRIDFIRGMGKILCHNRKTEMSSRERRRYEERQRKKNEKNDGRCNK